jgi:hypothetical protein
VKMHLGPSANLQIPGTIIAVPGGALHPSL